MAWFDESCINSDVVDMNDCRTLIVLQHYIVRAERERLLIGCEGVTSTQTI